MLLADLSAYQEPPPFFRQGDFVRAEECRSLTPDGHLPVEIAVMGTERRMDGTYQAMSACRPVRWQLLTTNRRYRATHGEPDGIKGLLLLIDE